MKYLIYIFLFFGIFKSVSQNNLNQQFTAIESKVIKWRRDFHKNPELSNREFKTAEKIAIHLKSLGLDVQTGIAHTGVVAILKGKHPGKVIALRADIDALPVTERNDLPFKSEVKTTFLNTETGVMHACGHDTHTAILMGVAEILANNKDKIRGTVKFIFQPAEEGPPPGEEGGAALMIKEGVLENPKVDAIFGLHIRSNYEIGTIHYKSGGTMAAVDRFVLNVKGKQTHGGRPWQGVDPILISAKIIDGFQSIISRETKLVDEAAVISFGKITAGTRFNIIPESTELIGTIRTLDPEMRSKIIKRMHEMSDNIAKAYGGEAKLDVQEQTAITYNDPDLTNQTLPSLYKAIGKENVRIRKATTGGEDFSYFQEKIPGFYFFLGGMTPGNTQAFPHHTPDFVIDDSGLISGVKALTQITFDFLNK
ncbi:amidohydrolase [Algibacter mikhailovii]|uniref:N-acyl-L-amino acid amidohydrolase n=1 Tax=Algibacter mikhailovii TaxID=425498 RepID=A0A918QRH2_9FLAO|nr:amidohydrolase [Algibacter mikhailovii]GGZ68567.1 N-acyl-L-amino acid amidohydrolase [Algibacter mikhailovii]